MAAQQMSSVIIRSCFEKHRPAVTRCGAPAVLTARAITIPGARWGGAG